MTFSCAKCQTKMNVNTDNHEGESLIVACPKCGQKNRIQIPENNKNEQVIMARTDASGASSTTSLKGSNEKFCSECGQVILAKAEICPKCGVRQMSNPSEVGKNGGDSTPNRFNWKMVFAGFGVGMVFQILIGVLWSDPNVSDSIILAVVILSYLAIGVFIGIISKGEPIKEAVAAGTIILLMNSLVGLAQGASLKFFWKFFWMYYGLCFLGAWLVVKIKSQDEDERSTAVVNGTTGNGPVEEYSLIEGKTGEAFCMACRTTSPINGMYYRRVDDTYYHKDCIPKK